MKKRLLMTTIGVMLCLFANAQNEVDAIRYSLKSTGGNARTLAMGGAIGALGSDIGNIGINPAGLGLSRSSQFSMSLGFYNVKSESDYINNLSSDNKFNLNIPNLGFKMTTINTSKGKPVEEGWSSFTFGLNVNRTNNFHSRSFYDGVNTSNSMTDYFAQLNNGSSTHPLDYDIDQEPLPYLGYQTGLVDYDSSRDVFTSAITSDRTNVTQTGSILTSGATNEYNMALGANHSNKLYFGLGLNVQTVNFDQEKSFKEVDNEPDTGRDFYSLNFTELLKTTGAGVGVNLGIIFKPTHFLRFGIGYQSPRVLHLKDQFSYSMGSEFDLGTVDQYTNEVKNAYSEASNTFEYTYKVVTPARVTGSVAVQFDKKGMITADIGMVDYSNARLEVKEEGDPDFNLQNKAIRAQYGQAMNYRIGGEINSGMYRFRAGYAYEASPFRDNAIKFKEDLAKKSVSAGIGIADKNYTLDMTYVHSKWAEFTQPYTLSGQESHFVTHNRKSGQLIVTLGVKL